MVSVSIGEYNTDIHGNIDWSYIKVMKEGAGDLCMLILTARVLYHGGSM